MDNPSETRRTLLLAVLAAGLSLAGYAVISRLTYGLGYPLDDAWIHQAYARNLGLRGEWAFIPGRPSAGSTAPLWALMLAVGYVLRMPHLLWSGLLCWVTLTAVGYLGYLTLRKYVPEVQERARWVIILLALEWHLVWAAGSGMETLLAGLLILFFFYRLSDPVISWFVMGLIIGLGVWIRPDLLTLLGPVGLVAVLRHPRLKPLAAALAQFGAGFALLFLPYLAFNRVLAGAVWPNTFYAKQAEYEILLTAPYLSRYYSQLQLPLVGVGLVLFPGLLVFLQRGVTTQGWERFAGPIWWFAYLGVYAARLPVTYQHGRYLMPAMPIYFVWGFAGLLMWVRSKETIAWRRVLGNSWVIVVALVLAAFWVLGGRAFARDVAFIESEMVAVARWIRDETSEGVVLAAHDIGALGYFGGRDILDMAGLISPDVIPFIRDEAALARHLDANQVDYLVTFPGWYPELVAGRTAVYSTNGQISPLLGGENMAVFKWEP